MLPITSVSVVGRKVYNEIHEKGTTGTLNRAGKAMLYFSLDSNSFNHIDCEPVFNSDTRISKNVLVVSKVPSAYKKRWVHGANGGQIAEKSYLLERDATYFSRSLVIWIAPCFSYSLNSKWRWSHDLPPKRH